MTSKVVVFYLALITGGAGLTWFDVGVQEPSVSGQSLRDGSTRGSGYYGSGGYRGGK